VDISLSAGERYWAPSINCLLPAQLETTGQAMVALHRQNSKESTLVETTFCEKNCFTHMKGRTILLTQTKLKLVSDQIWVIQTDTCLTTW
jgi:hypothetical protein